MSEFFQDSLTCGICGKGNGVKLWARDYSLRKDTGFRYEGTYTMTTYVKTDGRRFGVCDECVQNQLATGKRASKVMVPLLLVVGVVLAAFGLAGHYLLKNLDEAETGLALLFAVSALLAGFLAWAEDNPEDVANALLEKVATRHYANKKRGGERVVLDKETYETHAWGVTKGQSRAGENDGSTQKTS